MLKNIGKVFYDKNRTHAIRKLILEGYNVAVLDDGFQDFTIKKDFSILCFNSKQLIGNGLVIPSGPLRENFNSILRANCIVINGDKNLEFENKIKEISKNIKNKEIIAFAGIGNPSNFFDLLKENNLNLKKTYSFPDHHFYSQKDFDKIIGDNITKIVTTEKDYYRMNDEQKKNCYCVVVDLEIENKDEFINLIKSKL